jgi:hypothetical protein
MSTLPKVSSDGCFPIQFLDRLNFVLCTFFAPAMSLSFYVNTGQLTYILGENGQEWTIMDENGRECTIMDRNGREWTRMDNKYENEQEWTGMDDNGQ